MVIFNSATLLLFLRPRCSNVMVVNVLSIMVLCVNKVRAGCLKVNLKLVIKMILVLTIAGDLSCTVDHLSN